MVAAAAMAVAAAAAATATLAAYVQVVQAVNIHTSRRRSTYVVGRFRKTRRSSAAVAAAVAAAQVLTP